MSGLPRTLAPWAALLAPLADDLALGMGEWARRIAAALGPLERARPDTGEPDGFSGLSRRGPYDRLLLTEWLLAHELPEEFTRRAAMNEHLFLERGRRSLGAPQGLVAVVDAGPDQLGTPRIAQLAVLVVLAARAEAATAELRWGTLQEPGELRRGFDEDAVRRFLAARSHVPASPELGKAWAEVEALRGGELWLVGGERLLASLALPAARVLLEEVPSPTERALRLELRRRGSSPRELRLPLPPAPECTRLLRDPFKPRAPLPPATPREHRRAAWSEDTVDPQGGILFAPFGSRAAIRLQGGRILDLRVPTSGAEPPGRTGRRRIPEGFLGFGWAGPGRKHLTVHATPATAGKVWLRVATPWGEQAESLPADAVGMVDPAVPLQPCLLWPRLRSNRTWFLDGRRTLRVMNGNRSEVVATEVVALSAGAALGFVFQSGGTAVLGLRRGTESAHHELGAFSGRALLGCLGPERGLDMGHVAVETRPGGPWTLGMARWDGLAFAHQLQPFPGTEVVGLASTTPLDLALVVIEADRRTFTCLSRSAARPLHVADAPIATAAVDPTGDHLGYVTTAGDLVFRTVTRDRLLLHRKFKALR